MPTRHIVQQGDHLSSIAKRYGFTNFLTIWNAGDNSQLRSLRQNPHVLFPGDVVVVPEKQLGDETRSTDQRHRFKLKAPALKLRIVLEDMYDQPVMGARCTLIVEGQSSALTTDGDGRVELAIPRDAHDAVLVVQDPVTPFLESRIALRIGDLDPVEEFAGQVQRLQNLGYLTDDVVSAQDEEFRSAVEEFQCDQKLGVDGICGKNTQAALLRVHGV